MIYVTQDQMSTSAWPRLAGHSPTNRQNIRLRKSDSAFTAIDLEQTRLSGWRTAESHAAGRTQPGNRSMGPMQPVARKKVEARNEHP